MMTLSTAVPSKSTGTFVARRVVAFLREIGCLQCDVVGDNLDRVGGRADPCSERRRQVHCRVQPSRQQRQQCEW